MWTKNWDKTNEKCKDHYQDKFSNEIIDHVLQKREFGQEMERKNDHDYILLYFLPKTYRKYKKHLHELLRRRTQGGEDSGDETGGGM